jgi:hypothetical protein
LFSDSSIPSHIATDEDEETRQWRLSQHAIFIQGEGVDMILKYLIERSGVNTQRFNVTGVFERFNKMIREEEEKAIKRMLGETIPEVVKIGLPSFFFFAL